MIGDIQPLITFHEPNSIMELNLGQFDFEFPILSYICGKEVIVDDKFIKKSTEGYNWAPPSPGPCSFLIEYDGTCRTDAEIFKRELLSPSQSRSSSSESSSDEEMDQFGNTPPRRRRTSISSGGSDSRWSRVRESESSDDDELLSAGKKRSRRSASASSESSD